LKKLQLKKRLRDKKTIILLIIIGIAIALRFFAFTSLPAGLNQDELSAGYESYSLVHNGTDRWGAKWPAYFLSWGSGQNVLLSYLMMPIIAIFGLSAATIRVIPALLGVGSVILLYFTIKKAANVNTGLVAAAVLAVSPWAVFGSRWGLESNILPFFMLLGVFSFLYSRGSHHAKFLIPISLVPFALALYAYAIAIFVVPLLLVGLFILYRKEILQRKMLYAISVAVFLLVATPILLFFFVNSVLHSSPAFLTHLPFSVPLLVENRLSQVHTALIATNKDFIITGFQDHYIQNGPINYIPLALSPLPLVLIGALVTFTDRLKAMFIFVIWAAAGCVLFLVAPLNLNRANTLMIPFIVLSSYALVWILGQIRPRQKRLLVTTALAITAVGYFGLCYVEYARNYNEQSVSEFRPGFTTALAEAQRLATPNEKIYISNLINLNYMYTLFGTKADSKDFAEAASFHVTDSPVGKVMSVDSYRNYFFDPKLPTLQEDPYVYITVKGDNLPCTEPQTTYRSGMWYVGRCLVPAPLVGTMQP
jgi:4-amino-4-deoxy-L-arabinose transferase-like glycosyltransferase